MKTRTRPRVLVVDDGETYARAVGQSMPEVALVRPGGPGAEPRAPDGPAAIAFLERHPGEVDLVLLDVRFDVPPDRLLPLAPGASPRRTARLQGLAILREIRRRWPDLPVVLLTSESDLAPDEVDAVSSQSMTWFLDGDALDALRIRIDAALRDAALALDEAGILWGRDPAMRDVRRRLAVLARGRMPVILEGETGTGKSFLAERFVHANSGRKGPFVIADLATLPPDLVPAHLFGAVRGAWTGAVADRKGVFELADRGTLFLDEVENIPPEAQRQLLGVLQERVVRPIGSGRAIPVDVKVIAASNAPLAEAVAAGRFRADLYMRLSPATRVVVPPLRERPADVERLLRAFGMRAADDPDTAALRDAVADAVGLPRGAPMALVPVRARGPAADPARLELAVPGPAWDRLLAHPWPGNVRELESVVANLVTFTLVAAVDAVRSGVGLRSHRLQVDPALVPAMLEDVPGQGGAVRAQAAEARAAARAPAGRDAIAVHVEAAPTLAGVASGVERQYLAALFRETGGDFGRMAERLLGDPARGRAVRLRMNQLGMKVREMRSPVDR